MGQKVRRREIHHWQRTRKWVNRREGSFGSLGKVVTTMDFLLKLFEDITDSKTEIKYSDAIKSMANDAWNKLNKYYSMTEASEAYIASVVLDPRIKWVYFAKQWPD
jgi:hypothetical protein